MKTSTQTREEVAQELFNEFNDHMKKAGEFHEEYMKQSDAGATREELDALEASIQTHTQKALELRQEILNPWA
jgi:hypothetical protein